MMDIGTFRPRMATARSHRRGQWWAMDTATDMQSRSGNARRPCIHVWRGSTLARGRHTHRRTLAARVRVVASTIVAGLAIVFAARDLGEQLRLFPGGEVPARSAWW
jgi:hypothetical protein